MQYNGNILKVNSTSNTYLQNINEKMTKVDRYSCRLELPKKSMIDLHIALQILLQSLL